MTIRAKFSGSGGLLSLATAALLLGATSAKAIDVDPGDYVAAAPGTNLGLLYGQYAKRTKLNTTTQGDIPSSQLESEVGIARFVHFTEIAGITVDPQILVPFGTLNNAQIDGQSVKDSYGIGDPILAATAWLINDPKQNRYLGITPYVWLPIGTYREGATFNIGENRWKGAIQAGLVQGITDKVTFEFIADATFYGDNKNAGTGHQTLSQDESFQIQPWLRYNFTPTQAAAVGYSGTFGGTQELDGTSNGFKTSEHQLRLQYQGFVTPTVQLLGTVATDVAASGGFREDFRTNFRILKMF